jgi:hypothetical protein
MENLSSMWKTFFSFLFLAQIFDFENEFFFHPPCVWIPFRILFSRLLSRNKRSTATNFYVNEGEEKRNWIGKNIAKKRRKLNKYWLSFLKSILYFFFLSFSLSLFNFLATHFIGAEIFFCLSIFLSNVWTSRLGHIVFIICAFG